MKWIKKAWQWYAEHEISILVGFEFNITRWAWLPDGGPTPDKYKSYPNDWEYSMLLLGLRVVFGCYKSIDAEGFTHCTAKDIFDNMEARDSSRKGQ